MNQPTREEFNDHEARIKKLEHQQTEPMKAVRVDVASEDVLKKLDAIQDDTGVLKIEMEGARADIRVVKANQSDLRDYIEEQFKSVEAKQDDHTEVLGQLVNFSESHTKRFDHIDTTMATQGDIAALKVTQDEQNAKLDEQGKRQNAMDTKLDQILSLLQQKPSE